MDQHHFKITAGITEEDSSYEIYENVTHRWIFDVSDFCEADSLFPCTVLGQFSCDNETNDVNVYLMTYGCADDSADNGSSSNVGCPNSNGVPIHYNLLYISTFL